MGVAARVPGATAAILAIVVMVAGCAGSLPSDSPSATPTAANPARTFPPSQTPIEAGTYMWSGFEHPITVQLGAGWDLGHNDPTFFDLFRGSDFPSVTFARFTDIYVDGTTREAATRSALVLAKLSIRADVVLTKISTIELGGLQGQQFDLATTAAKTPLFFGAAGDFRLDPEFKTRYRVLDFPGGGILVIGIHAHLADFDAAVALGDPIVATLTVER
jgi:hypothetical protein